MDQEVPMPAAPPDSNPRHQVPRMAVSHRSALMVIGGALAVVLGFAFWNRPQTLPPDVRPSPEAMVLPVSAAPVAPARVTVHVSGAVAAPGLVALPEGSRVADAIARAGGALAGAELRLVNLAEPVADGSQLVVPWAGDAAAPESASPNAAASAYPVDLNRAGEEALARIPGVGPVLAGRIVAHRDSHGPFTAMEDLLDVPGIGEGRLAAMRDHAVVNR